MPAAEPAPSDASAKPRRRRRVPRALKVVLLSFAGLVGLVLSRLLAPLASITNRAHDAVEHRYANFLPYAFAHPGQILGIAGKPRKTLTLKSTQRRETEE